MTPQDKDAFFSLLDEYFASRPELFGNGGGGATNGIVTRAAATSAVHQALSAAPALAAPAVNGWKRPQASPAADTPAEESAPMAGRVAAAAAMLRAANAGPAIGSTPAQNGFPRPPPRRVASNGSDEVASAASEAGKFVQGRKFGDVDMSSGKNMFTSIRGSTAAKNAAPAQVAPPQPPAFSRNAGFAPPPKRTSSAGAPAPAASPTPPPALPRRQPTQEEAGEWAEALYPYTSDDPGDLDLEEGDRVFVIEKTSDDWWTGEIDGRRGLIPAAYVKSL